jgi:hypothetical protein
MRRDGEERVFHGPSVFLGVAGSSRVLPIDIVTGLARGAAVVEGPAASEGDDYAEAAQQDQTASMPSGTLHGSSSERIGRRYTGSSDLFRGGALAT